MKILQKFGEIVSPNDPELVEKTLARLNERDTWNDVFSTKLIELLDKVDHIKREIRERLREADERIRQAQSVTQAESILLRKSEEFGEASQRLELAQAAEQRATALATDAKQKLEKASIALESARALANDTNEKLRLAREAELRSARVSDLAVRYSAWAVALSWIAVVWTGWFMVRTATLLWIAVDLSIVITFAAILVVR